LSALLRLHFVLEFRRFEREPKKALVSSLEQILKHCQQLQQHRQKLRRFHQRPR
jgi:DNA-directed RNA polymerase subunit L